MNIRPSAEIRQNYNEIAELCRSSKAPVYLTTDGEGDLVVMDIESFIRREKTIQLRENLLAVEEDRTASCKGCAIDELDSFLDGILNADTIINGCLDKRIRKAPDTGAFKATDRLVLVLTKF